MPKKAASKATKEARTELARAGGKALVRKYGKGHMRDLVKRRWAKAKARKASAGK